MTFSLNPNTIYFRLFLVSVKNFMKNFMNRCIVTIDIRLQKDNRLVFEIITI